MPADLKRPTSPAAPRQASTREAGFALAATWISTLAYGLAFPRFSLWPLAWVALVPFFVALRTGSPRRAIVLSWLWTVAAAYAVTSWFPRAIAVYFQQPVAVGIALFFAVSTVMGAVDY